MTFKELYKQRLSEIPITCEQREALQRILHLEQADEDDFEFLLTILNMHRCTTEGLEKQMKMEIAKMGAPYDHNERANIKRFNETFRGKN